MEIVFILMAPARPENVGAAARALKTMGFSRLRIVASDVHLRPEADWWLMVLRSCCNKR